MFVKAPVETTFLAAVRDVLRSLGLSDDPPPAGGALRDAWEARAAVLRLAEEAPEGTTLRGFTDELMARGRALNVLDVEGVNRVCVLDSKAASGDYSSRAAGAAQCVATGEKPEVAVL